MEFRVLGPVAVAAGERRAGFPSGRRRTLLAALLAAGGETVTTGRLIEAVWGPEPPASARKSLQSHCSRLRSELEHIAPAGAAPLVTGTDGYRVDLRAHDLDAARFADLVVRARARLDVAPAEARELLDAALALWRGPAYGELAALPAVRAEAVRLERLRAAAAADRVDAQLALGLATAVGAELAARVRDDPLDERAHGQLMRARYLDGSQAEALATYRRLADRLREQLGIDPSPELQRLHERLLRHDPELVPALARRDGRDGRVPARASPGAATPRGGHEAAGPAPGDGEETTPGPARPPTLLGRERDVAAVAALITAAPLVTCTGPGGVGKTRLAEQVGARVADAFADGVVVVALAGVRDAAGVEGAVTTALGIQPSGDATARDTLASALGERRLLLLLDNCEHLLATVAALVDTLVARCPALAVLATSRERLRLPTERVWPVAPLDVPDRGADGPAVAATAAGALFAARAEAVDPGFALTDDNATAVGELCRRLDGMPLAIELAAARVRALAPQDLVARLDRRFSLLAGGPRHEAGRHRTLRAVVAWSYELLDDAEATLFDRLSVFAGSFSLAAAEQVGAGGTLDEAAVAGLLGELVDKSMVVVEHRGAGLRYRLLDTLREFGARRLADAGETRRRRRAHADHHVALAEELGPRIRGPNEGAAVAEVDAALDDLRAAHGHLVDVGDVDGALRLPTALADDLFFRLRDEVTLWVRRALALPGADGHPAAPAALAAAAWGATSRDECDRARREAERALARADGAGLTAARALGAAGTAALYEGRLGDALACAEQQAAVADRLDSAYYRAFAGVLEVIGHLYRGEQPVAAAAVAVLHEAATASGNPTMRAFAHYCAGEVHLDTRPQAAATSLERAVELARRVDNALIEGVSQVSLASLRARGGRPAEALARFREVIAHWRRLGDHTHQLTTLRNVVQLLADLERDEPAAVLHGAVTAGLAPSFGAEARRLADAWARVEGRLGPAAAAAAAARGRELPATRVGALALEELDELLAARNLGATAEPQPVHSHTP